MVRKNQELKKRVIFEGREKDTSYAKYRNAIGKKVGLHGSDFICLDLIFYRGATTPSELALYTGLSPGSTTAMVDRLEKSGFVVRRPSPDSRRVVLVVFAKDGAEKIVQLFQSARAVQEKLLEDYSENELKILSDYFRKVAAAFEEERKKLSLQLDRANPRGKDPLGSQWL